MTHESKKHRPSLIWGALMTLIWPSVQQNFMLYCRICCISTQDETDFLPLKRLIRLRWRRCRRSKPKFSIWCPSWESIYHSFRLLGRFFRFPVSGYSTFYSINDLPGWPLKDGMTVFYQGLHFTAWGSYYSGSLDNRVAEIDTNWWALFSRLPRSTLFFSETADMEIVGYCMFTHAD